MDKEPIEREREYLEGLLNTRFNFFLLVMSGLGAALLAEGNLGSPTSRLLLVLGTIAALAMGLIILRTAALLRVILEIMVGKRAENGGPLAGQEAEKEDRAAPPATSHPYRIAAYWVGKRSPWFLKSNANRIVEMAAYGVILLLAGAALASFAGCFDPRPKGAAALSDAGLTAPSLSISRS